MAPGSVVIVRACEMMASSMKELKRRRWKEEEE